MKLIKEYAKITNLETGEETEVDDDGTIHFADDDDFMNPDAYAGDTDSLRPDGTYDELDFEEKFENPLGYLDDELPDEFPDDGELPPDELDPDAEGLEGDGLGGEGDLEGMSDEKPLEDPKYQGVIRTVRGAFLAHKIKSEDGTFEELWVYNKTKDLNNDAEVKRRILSGTDIPKNDVTSDDGMQKVTTKNIGNVIIVKIEGLPN